MFLFAYINCELAMTSVFSGEPSRLLSTELEEALSDSWIGRYAREHQVVNDMMRHCKLAFQIGKVSDTLVPILLPLTAVEALKVLKDEEIR